MVIDGSMALLNPDSSQHSTPPSTSIIHSISQVPNYTLHQIPEGTGSGLSVSLQKKQFVLCRDTNIDKCFHPGFVFLVLVNGFLLRARSLRVVTMATSPSAKCFNIFYLHSRRAS